MATLAHIIMDEPVADFVVPAKQDMLARLVPIDAALTPIKTIGLILKR